MNAFKRPISNEEGFGYKRWYDYECNMLYNNMILKKKVNGPSSLIYKNARAKYRNCCKKKKFMFEVTMSKKLEHLRGKDSKAFWNLLKEGFDTNKVGNIDMDDWYAHFSSLFLMKSWTRSLPCKN